MKKDMPLEGLRWSRDSGSALYDTPQNGRSRTGWGIEQYVECCAHIGTLCTESMNHLQEVVDGEE